VSDWHDVGALDELRRSGRLIARVGGREVGVVVVDGELCGVRNRCPHHGGPLCLGSVERRLAGRPGGYDLTGELVLRCPWHGWEFDPATGACLDDPGLRVAVYPVEVVGGRVRVRA
jgi:nitrite reductase/ring-hydroxylating ferredoxin subunit